MSRYPHLKKKSVIYGPLLARNRACSGLGFRVQGLACKVQVLSMCPKEACKRDEGIETYICNPRILPPRNRIDVQVISHCEKEQLKISKVNTRKSRCSVWHDLQCVAVCCSVLPCVAVCCRVLPCVAGCCRVLQGVAVCCRVLQCVAVCFSVLQCVAVCCMPCSV